MKALTWHGANNVKVENVEDPKIVMPTDAIIEVTSSAICGSDLHIYHGLIPEMKQGDILGHEFAGKVIEVGSEVRRVKVGDRVVIPFVIACGNCIFCEKGLFAACITTNPNGEKQAKVVGYPTAGLFGYSHMYGGFSGGQAQYARVPFIDVGACILPENISEEHALFLSDIFPTGYMAAENCNIQPGQKIAVWGCGPVGQFAIRSAMLLGAENVFAIDEDKTRLDLAASCGATPIDFSKEDVYQVLKNSTRGLGPDACIDAVGMESNGHTPDAFIDGVLQAVKLQTDRSHALREALMCCRSGGIVSMPGVYIGILDNFPLGIAFGKGLTLKMGQTHVQKYLEPLLQRIMDNEIDPRFLISHKITMDEIPDAYAMFAKHEHGCTKVVIEPQVASETKAA